MNDGQSSRQRFSTQVDSEVQSLARAAVRGVRATSDSDYTLAQLTEDALRSWIQHLADVYHDGQPWRPNDHHLPPGRP